MNELQLLTLHGARKIAYAQYGDPAGIPLFYFHGWPSSRLQGKLLHAIGKQAGFCVIAPDRPGIGWSDAQPDRALLDWPAVVREMADHLGIGKFYVMGVSGGGPYTLATVHALGERVLGAAVVCGAPPLGEGGAERLMWPYRAALLIRKRLPVLLDQTLKLAARISQQPQNGWVMRRLMASLGAEDRRALAAAENYHIITHSFRESLRSGVEAVRTDGDLYSQPWGFDPATLARSPHFWHGGRDKNIPLSLVNPYIDRIPGAQLTVCPEDGHYSLPLLRGPEIAEALLQKPKR